MKESKSSGSSFRVSAVRRECCAELRAAGITSPDLEFDLLLALALKTTRGGALAVTEIDCETLTAVRSLVAKRAARYPFQYITGFVEFCGRDFSVGEGCFIPRPETESIVEEAVRLRPSRVAEIGVGCGNITLSLALRLERAVIAGFELSPAALRYALLNYSRLRDEIASRGNRILLCIADALCAVSPRSKGFDLIVSNPPYVCKIDKNISPEILYEPDEALYADCGGLAFIEMILKQARRHLSAGGHVLLEMGYDQHERVELLSKSLGYLAEKFIIDMEGRKRGILLKL